MDLPLYPAGIFWINPLGSFKFLIKMYPQCAWATHWELFQSIPSYLITIYSMIYSMSSLRICCEFFEKSPLDTLWAHFWVFFERTLNEWLRSIVGIFWSKLWKNPGSSFKKYLLGKVWTNCLKYQKPIIRIMEDYNWSLDVLGSSRFVFFKLCTSTVTS